MEFWIGIWRFIGRPFLCSQDTALALHCSFPLSARGRQALCSCARQASCSPSNPCASSALALSVFLAFKFSQAHRSWGPEGTGASVLDPEHPLVEALQLQSAVVLRLDTGGHQVRAGLALALFARLLCSPSPATVPAASVQRRSEQHALPAPSASS